MESILATPAGLDFRSDEWRGLVLQRKDWPWRCRSDALGEQATLSAPPLPSEAENDNGENRRLHTTNKKNIFTRLIIK